MDENAITFKNVTKQFSLPEDRTFKELLPNLFRGKTLSRKFVAISDVSFNIKKGETMAIIGKNGAGKSTILKLIAGVTAPSRGTVSIHGKVAPLIELGAGFHHELTGLENIYLNSAILGMHKKEIEAQVENIINFSELREFINVPVKKYSSGMYMRLGFSVAIHTNADILLIDEVLAVGDAAFQEKCLNYLKGLKKAREKTIVFVSHNEHDVKNFCDRAILVEGGKVAIDDTPEKAYQLYHKYISEDKNPK